MRKVLHQRVVVPVKVRVCVLFCTGSVTGDLNPGSTVEQNRMIVNYISLTVLSTTLNIDIC